MILTRNTKTKSSINAIEVYDGPWTEKEASHLLRRTMFGPSQSLIQECVDLGLQGTIDLMLENTIPNEPPVRHTLDETIPGQAYLPVFTDPNIAYGETWVNEPPIPNSGNAEIDQNIIRYRQSSVYGWTFNNLIQNKLTLMPKLFMFWHNHFVVSDFRAPLLNYNYAHLVETFAKGNFREFTKAMTLDASMLLYLNGNENFRQAPNENYARELLELFTVGKGALAGPGDYTTFTEDDVTEIAKILTGWHIDPSQIPEKVEVIFTPFLHTLGTKTLSHRFNNTTIAQAGEEEYKNLIDVIFENPAASKFICRKLYRYFLNYEITEEIESNIIEPLSQLLRENDFEIAPVIRCLLTSQHFFGEEVLGCMIKNPCDFLTSITRGLDVTFDDEIAVQYYTSSVLFAFAEEMDMAPYFHPDVAGWKAYYQAPQYYRTWINTYSLPKRTNASLAFIKGGQIGISNQNFSVPPLVPVLDLITKVSDPFDVNILLKELVNLMFTYDLTEPQLAYLKEILIPGLPDYEWTIEYSEFLAAQNDPQLINSMTNKLQNLFGAMVELPEFQLM